MPDRGEGEPGTSASCEPLQQLAKRAGEYGCSWIGLLTPIERSYGPRLDQAPRCARGQGGAIQQPPGESSVSSALPTRHDATTARRPSDEDGPPEAYPYRHPDNGCTAYPPGRSCRVRAALPQSLTTGMTTGTGADPVYSNRLICTIECLVSRIGIYLDVRTARQTNAEYGENNGRGRGQVLAPCSIVVRAIATWYPCSPRLARLQGAIVGGS